MYSLVLKPTYISTSVRFSTGNTLSLNLTYTCHTKYMTPYLLLEFILELAGGLICRKIFLSFQTITPLPINFPLKKWSFHLNYKFIII